MNGARAARAVCWTIVGLLVAWLVSCSWFVLRGDHGFAKVATGDTKTVVLGKMGIAHERRTACDASPPWEACHPPCVERLWFRNPVSIVEESWVVDIDADGKVIDKTHITSP